jgi:hypothetical protein
MLIGEPLPFVKEYVEEINKILEELKPGQGLSQIQRKWLSFCLMGIVVTNSICWAKFERAGLRKYRVAALSWMFRYAKIPWESLLELSVLLIVRKYRISSCTLVVDDSDKRRSKSTKRIPAVQVLKDKSSDGHIMGQNIVLLLLVSERVTIPVGFSFYEPDPDLQAWEQKDKQLQEQGVPKKSEHQSLREILLIQQRQQSHWLCWHSSNTHILSYG